MAKTFPSKTFSILPISAFSSLGHDDPNALVAKLSFLPLLIIPIPRAAQSGLMDRG
jgi:hypothetical protein